MKYFYVKLSSEDGESHYFFYLCSDFLRPRKAVDSFLCSFRVKAPLKFTVLDLWFFSFSTTHSAQKPYFRRMDKSSRFKTFSDPVHGFLTVPKGDILKLLDHPYIQRLRRIRQLGLGYLVFPGAEHSRFSHVLGATGLMYRVLNNLREKDTTITGAEFDATLMAILLHDVGHGPFSHTLEHSLISDFHHEMMTLAIMERLNREFEHKLDLAIEIFKNEYSKGFLHQLISSQLDIDRIDYLKRDSAMTGVSEGSIGIDRILKTMRVFNGQIVIQRKGIYAIENYIIARRLMYMQVYLHKTVLSADHLLRAILQRVRDLLQDGTKVFFAAPALEYYLKQNPSAKDGISEEMIAQFVMLDDNDLITCIKYWQQHRDRILSDLSQRFLNRSLNRTTFIPAKPKKHFRGLVEEDTLIWMRRHDLPPKQENLVYYLSFNSVYSEAYKYQKDSLWILGEDRQLIEFSQASDAKHILALTQPVAKHYVSHPKDVQVPGAQ